MIRIADVSNIAANTVTLKSDGAGLAGLALAYNGALPAFGAGVGQVNVTGTGDLDGVLALDINSYSQPLNMAAIATGKMFLGTSVTSQYFAPTLGAGAGGAYRLGGGGRSGTLTIGAGAFENVLTGSASVQIGAVINGSAASGGAYVNGNTGTTGVVLSTRNDFTGGITVNPSASVNLQNALSAGTGPISVNNGNLNISNSQTIANAINVTGDSLLINTTGTFPFDTSSFTGNVNLAPNGIGGTRTFNVSGSGTSAATGFFGIVSDGGSVSNVVRTSTGNTFATSGGTVVFHAANTYHGTTTINAGFIMAGTDVLPNVAGALGISDTPVIFGPTAGGFSTQELGIAGQYTFGRDLIVTAATSFNVSVLRSQSLNNAAFTGGINVITGQLAIDASSSVNGVGGVFDIQGPITGAGTMQLGLSQGIVRLSANSSGISTSTLTGAVGLFAGRVQIAADSYFTGPASAPTAIIAGPFGTGTLGLSILGSSTVGANSQTPAGATIEAFGADRVIVNPLTPLNPQVGTTITFAGVNSLTFTRGLDLNNTSAVFARSLAVSMTRGSLTFSGILSSSGANGADLQKTGAGTLVLSGTNFQINADPTSSNHGTALYVDAGVVSVSAENSLGLSSVAVNGTASYGRDGAGIALTHASGNPSDIRIRGGVLQVTGAGFATSRSIIFGAAGGVAIANATAGIDVPGAAGSLAIASPLLTQTSAPTGSTTLTKTGAGTLALNSSASASPVTSLVIGGAPLATAVNQFSGVSGGTVSTTAVTGSPLVSALGGAAGGTITINGGTLALLGTGANLSIASLAYGGGSYFQTNAGGATLTVTTGVTRSGAGTLTLLPSALALLGVSEKLASASVPGNTLGMLTSPTVYYRLAGAGQDADFASYSAGFMQRTANAGDGATISATTVSGNAILPASAVADSSQIAAQTVNAVRTSANLNSPSQTLTIASGGLIMNRNTAGANAGVTIGTQLVFGASAVAPGEALVHVSDGTTSTPTISGNFTAANFTKSGPGDLKITGTANSMAPLGGSGGGLRTLTINEGSVRFAGQGSLPSGGAIIIAPQDAGTFDMAGQSLTVGGLTGTGRIVSVAIDPTLTLNVNNTGGSPTFNGSIGANIALVKSGTGAQILGYNNSYDGGTTINAGSIISAGGVFTPTGILQAGSYQSFGTGAISVAGGILSFATSTFGSQVEDNIAVLQQGPGNGYNITVPALNNFGTANTTATLNTAVANAWQAINTLTVNAPVISYNARGRTASS